MNIVCFKWRQQSGTSDAKTYKSQHVNALNRMLKKNVRGPFQLYCITDEQKGLDSDISAIALPGGMKQLPAQFPKIMLFSDDMREIVGESFIYMDLDVVITGNIDHIFPGNEVEFKVLAKRFAPTLWQQIKSKKCRRQRAFYNAGVKYNTSLVYCRAGARAGVYEGFDREQAYKLREYYMVPGSDQTWVYHCLGAREQTWTMKDGIFSYGSQLNRREKDYIPSHVKVVFFGGSVKPWHRKVMDSAPWVEEHYPVELL